MPEFPLRDTIVTSLNAQEPWPDNVKLFQPYEVEQILLPDNASCLAVQAFLKMCKLPFEVEMRWNAEFMSPSGRVPFIKCGAFVVSELEPIVQFAANKGVSLCTRLSTEEKAEMRAYMSLITNVLVNAELYISWIDNETFNTVTKVRNSSVYPWPLGWLQTRSKRNAIAKRLKALSWHDKTLEQVLSDVEQCCNSLSQRLGERDYFFGTPTPLDALIFGHMRALLSANGPKAALMIKPITSSLLKHTTRMSKLTEMALKDQEQYLITQAFQICIRRRINVDPLERGRAKKSKLGLKTISRDSFASDYKDVFGFKPFASKKVIIMTTKEGILCDFEETRNKFVLEEDILYIEELLDEIIDKVDECVKEPMVANLKNNVKFKDCLMGEFNEKLDKDNEKNDFEVIEFSRSKYERNDSPVSDVKLNYLDTIDENDLSDSTESLADPEDVIQIINEDGCDIIIDSDGIVNDKLLSSPEVFKVLSKNLLQKYGEDVNDPSIKKQISESHINIKSSGDMSEVTAKISKTSAKSLTPSGSKTLMNFPSNEEITVEKLLNYLRKKNAAYKDSDMPDID